MKIHAAALALLLVPAYADAQSSARTAPARPAAEEHQAAKPPTGEITLIGCVQREAAYRQAEHAAKGGPLHSGLGQGNEFVLTDARPIPAGKSAVGTSGGSGREPDAGSGREPDADSGPTVHFPGAAQAYRIIRYTGGLDGQRTTKEVVHGITNLTPEQADPTRLADLTNRHWGIESIHWVRDTVFGEDASRIRTGAAPAVLAALRNVVTTAFRLAGHTSIAAARRATVLNPRQLVALLKRPHKTDKPPL